MTYRRNRLRRRRVAALLVVIGALAVALDQWPAASSSLVSSLPAAASPIELPRRQPRPDHAATIAGDLAKLDADLLDALRQAATDAADDGIEFTVESGWRSPEHQAQLFREAVAKYGSEAEAARWVATPNTSAHVSGDAVDIGPSDAAAWLSRHGDAYGLCQIYGNEPWHYELRREAMDGGCPPMYADPTDDPRMQQ